MKYLIERIYILLGVLLGSYYALWIPGLLARGMNLSQLSLIISLRVGIGLLLEVPTGILADRFGHRLLSIVGVSLFLPAFFAATFSASPMALAITVLLVGVGETILNGALQTWASQIVSGNGKGSENETGNANIIPHTPLNEIVRWDQLQRLGMIVGCLLIPYTITLLKLSQNLAWAPHTLVASALLFLMHFSGGKTKTESHPLAPGPLCFGGLKKNILTIGHGLHLLLVGWFFLGAADATIELTFLPRFQSEFHVEDALWFGVLQALLSSVRMAGSKLWKRFQWVHSPLVPSLSVVVSSVLFFCYALTNSAPISLVFWLIRIFVISIYFSTMSKIILNHSNLRVMSATVFSAAALSAGLGKFAFSAFMNFANISSGDIYYIALSGACITFISGFVLMFGLRRLIGGSARGNEAQGVVGRV